MDIPIKTVHRTQVFHHTYQTFHRIIGGPYHTGTQEQSFDIIPFVELHRQVYQFRYGECGTRNIIRAAVDTISTIVNTIVRQHDFQQGDATSVLSKTMANTDASHGIPHSAFHVTPHRTARRAGHIIFGRLCQYLQLPERIVFHAANHFCFCKDNPFQQIRKKPLRVFIRSGFAVSRSKVYQNINTRYPIYR